MEESDGVESRKEQEMRPPESAKSTHELGDAVLGEPFPHCLEGKQSDEDQHPPQNVPSLGVSAAMDKSEKLEQNKRSSGSEEEGNTPQ